MLSCSPTNVQIYYVHTATKYCVDLLWHLPGTAVVLQSQRVMQ